MERDQTKRQVVITGFGAVTPVGHDRESTWQSLVAGNSGVGPITAFDASGLAVQIAAEVRDFDSDRYLDRQRVRRAARFAQFAIVAAREAVADAHLSIGAGSDVGVVINAAVAGFDTIEAAGGRPGDQSVFCAIVAYQYACL